MEYGKASGCMGVSSVMVFTLEDHQETKEGGIEMDVEFTNKKLGVLIHCSDLDIIPRVGETVWLQGYSYRAYSVISIHWHLQARRPRIEIYIEEIPEQ